MRLQHKIRQEQDPFDLSKACKISIELSYSDKIYPFNDITVFLKKSKKADDCYTLALDGFGYRHEVISESTDIKVRWSNPDEQEHPVQFHIVSSYFNIVNEALLNMGDEINKIDTTKLLPPLLI